MMIRRARRHLTIAPGLVAARDVAPFEVLCRLPASCTLSLDDGFTSDAVLKASEVGRSRATA